MGRVPHRKVLRPYRKHKALPIHIQVFVPSTKFNKSISAKEFKRRVMETVRFLNSAFGGSTRYNAIGSYKTDDGKHIAEGVVTVDSYAKIGDFRKARQRLEVWINMRKRIWKQFSIGYTFEEDLYLT